MKLFMMIDDNKEITRCKPNYTINESEGFCRLGDAYVHLKSRQWMESLTANKQCFKGENVRRTRKLWEVG